MSQHKKNHFPDLHKSSHLGQIKSPSSKRALETKLFCSSGTPGTGPQNSCAGTVETVVWEAGIATVQELPTLWLNQAFQPRGDASLDFSMASAMNKYVKMCRYLHRTARAASPTSNSRHRVIEVNAATRHLEDKLGHAERKPTMRDKHRCSLESPYSVPMLFPTLLFSFSVPMCLQSHKSRFWQCSIWYRNPTGQWSIHKVPTACLPW